MPSGWCSPPLTRPNVRTRPGCRCSRSCDCARQSLVGHAVGAARATQRRSKMNLDKDLLAVGVAVLCLLLLVACFICFQLWSLNRFYDHTTRQQHMNSPPRTFAAQASPLAVVHLDPRTPFSIAPQELLEPAKHVVGVPGSNLQQVSLRTRESSFVSVECRGGRGWAVGPLGRNHLWNNIDNRFVDTAHALTAVCLCVRDFVL